MCVSVKQELEQNSAAAAVPAAPVKLVKPVTDPNTATHTTPEKITAAKLFTPSEVYIYIRYGAYITQYTGVFLQGAKGQFLFFQLPDCLPLEGGGASDEVAMDTSTAPPTQSSSAHTNSDKRGGKVRLLISTFCVDFFSLSLRLRRTSRVWATFPMDTLERSGYTSQAKSSEPLHNLCIYTLSLALLIIAHSRYISRSLFPSLLRLVLGENTLDITMGTPCGFLQELVSLQTEGEGEGEPHMTVLGQLSHRLICTPDFETLINSTTAASNGCDSSSDHEHR